MSPPADDRECERVLDHLEALIDGDLSFADTRAVDDHVATCAACAAELRRARQTSDALHALPQIDPPPALLDRIRHAVGDRESERALRPRRLRHPLVAAAVIVLALAASMVWLLAHPAPDEVEARRAAADLRLALTTLGEVSQRINRTTAAAVFDQPAISASTDGLIRSLNLLQALEPAVEPEDQPPTRNPEGST